MQSWGSSVATLSQMVIQIQIQIQITIQIQIQIQTYTNTNTNTNTWLGVNSADHLAEVGRRVLVSSRQDSAAFPTLNYSSPDI